MQPTTPQKSPLESALERFTKTLEAWDPDDGRVDGLLASLRELHLRFDPRKDRVSAALCVTGMKLLEELRAHGSVGPEATVAAVGELAHGLRAALSADAPANAPALRPGARGPMLTLSGPSSGGLSLSMRTVENQKLGSLMTKLGMLTAEQVQSVLDAQAAQKEPRMRFGELAVQMGLLSAAAVESALRLQARGRGETPAPKQDNDPWGGSPL
jgi:hypothetical protein